MTRDREGVSMPSVFSDIRVVDLSQGMAGPMAAMVLADNGADVVKVEPPGGDWARSLPGFLMWNRGKRSVELDLHTSYDRASVRHLIDGCDVVISTFRSGQANRLGVDYQHVQETNPGAVYCTISGFGKARKYEDVLAYEGVVAANCGRMMGNGVLSGSTNPDAAERPIYVAAPTGSYGAAILAVQGIAAALFSRLHSGRGQQVETSLLDGFAATTMRLRFQREGDAILPVHQVPGRNLMLRGIALTFLTAECSDGRYIQMCARQDDHFHNWMAALGLSDVMKEERFAGAPMKFQAETDVIELEELVRGRMREKTQSEWMRLFVEEYDVGADPFLTPQEFLEHPQMVLNGRVTELEDALFGPVKQVGPLVSFSQTPGNIAKSAPQLGEHQALLKRGGFDPRSVERQSPERDQARRPPFAGVTVLEVAYFLAGPLGTTLLAELGARVIKVEPFAGDPYRRVGLESVHIVAGKESIAVNLKSPRGQEVLHRLIARADALVHNFRPGVPERLGLDYATASGIKPDLVYLYAGSYGSVGPESHRAAFHSTPNALSGGGILQAGIGNPPVDDSYPDPCAGIAVGAALAMGLLARRRYGSGQYVETTMLTSSGYVHSNDLVRYPGRPERLIPDHQQHGLHALYRLYRCADGWIFVGAVQEKEWVRLAKVLGRKEWLTDRRFSEGQARLQHDADLAGLCERLFAEGWALDWVRQLQAGGVPAALAGERTFEEFLAGEGLLQPEDHPVFGAYWRLPAKVRFTESGNRLAPASAAGEHTRAILEELGYTEAQQGVLESDGVVLHAAGIERAAAGTVR
jgi:crotonobetainyl-CoA:carnitine CoA-transferase CaiB-like acyl-CoA transferase